MLVDMVKSRNTPTITPKLRTLNALLLFPFLRNLQLVVFMYCDDTTLKAAGPPVPQLIMLEFLIEQLLACEKLMPPVTPEIERTFSKYKKLQPLIALIHCPLQLEIKLLYTLQLLDFEIAMPS